GPPHALALLEGSKIHCKRFCEAHAIPTAPARIHTDLQQALKDIANRKEPMVIKASGLCAGKGVVVAGTPGEAETAARSLFSLPAAREGILVEACIQGWETSYIVLAHGTNYLAWPSAQDHKRLLSGNRGPNTGGMGALSPSPGMTPALETRIRQSIIEPTLEALVRSQTPYRGFLYAGIMVDTHGAPHLLEFNCRLGDPEAQVLLFRLESDPYEMLDAAARGALDACTPRWQRDPALAVVLAAPGYPGSSPSGAAISGLDESEESYVKYFPRSHATGTCGSARR
ncbi:phosphoribosylamine--glycine ligase, partial [mine drainage metagenome]